MGRDLVEESPIARQTFEEANDVLGFDISQICFEGPESSLTATENAQPAILTVSIALLRILEYNGVMAPALVAGHSLGEYSALVAAGALHFADALRLVRRRGELMAACTDGTMAAVMGLELAPLADICAEVSQRLGPCVVANQNAPGQLVISGTVEAVAAAGEQARSAGAKRVMPLNVSAAFHSPLMHNAAEQLAQTIASTPIVNARIPVIANATATAIASSVKIQQELVTQVTAPVRWIDTIATMQSMGVTKVVEIGPGAVLTGLAKRIAPELERQTINMVQQCAALG